MFTLFLCFETPFCKLNSKGEVMKKKKNNWAFLLCLIWQIKDSTANPTTSTTTTTSSTTTSTNPTCNAAHFNNQSPNDCSYCLDCPDADHEQILGGAITTIQKVRQTLLRVFRFDFKDFDLFLVALDGKLWYWQRNSLESLLRRHHHFRLRHRHRSSLFL